MALGGGMPANAPTWWRRISSRPEPLPPAGRNLSRVSDLADLDDAELERQVEAVRERMRPLDVELATLRSERDLLLTEVRRRRRLAERTSRADLKARMREGT